MQVNGWLSQHMVSNNNGLLRTAMVTGLAVLTAACSSMDSKYTQAAEAVPQTSGSSTTPVAPLNSAAAQAVLNSNAQISSELQTALDKVNQFVLEKRPKQALEETQALIKSHPNNPNLLLLEGVIQGELGNEALAEKLFLALNKKYPHLPEPLNNLAVIYVNRGDLNRAISTLQQAFETHPSYARVQSNLRTLYTTLASQAYNKALNIGSQAPTPILASLSQIPATIATIPHVNSKLVVGAVTAEQPIAKTKPVAVKTSQQTVASAAVKKQDKANKTAEEVTAKAVAAAAVKTKQNNDKAKQIDAINKQLQGWLAAWTGQKPNEYIAFYTRNFKPANGISTKKWQAQRQVRLKRPSFIKVKLTQTKTELLDKNRAETRFVQSYQADHYRDLVEKSIVWTKQGGEWKISQERTVKKF